METSLEQIRKIITFELLSTYVSKIHLCSTLEDLVPPTKILITNLAAHVLPKFRVEFDHIDMPQDKITNDDFKQHFSSEQQLIYWIRQLSSTIKDKTHAIQLDLDLLNHNSQLFKQKFDEMAKFNSLNSVSDELQEILENKISSLELEKRKFNTYESALMAKIEQLFSQTNDQIISGNQKILVYRVTAPFIGEQNCFFPATEDLSFHNYFVAIFDGREADNEYNFVLSNGVCSDFQSEYKLEEVKIQPAAVKKVLMWYEDLNYMLMGFSFIGKDGTILYESGWQDLEECKCQETILDDDERIIGMRGRRDAQFAYYLDFQFVIGRLQ